MKRPILIIAIGYIIGILGGLYLEKSMVLFLSCIAIIIFIIKRKKSWKIGRYKRYIKLYINNKAIIILIITAIISSIIIYQKEKEYKKIENELCKTEDIVIKGKIKRETKTKEYGKIYKVQIEEITQNGKEIKAQKKNIYIQENKTKIKLQYGDIIEVKGKYEEPESRRNYKGFDYKLYLKTKNILGTLKSTNIKKVRHKIENPIEYIESKSIKLSENLKQKANNILPQEIASIFIGIILGDRTEIPEEAIENFRNANMSHILAVSGMHMSYLILLATQIIGKLIGKKQSYYISIILIIEYMFLTGFSASIIRAGIMGIILISSKIFYKNNDILTNIAISALIILLKNPYTILDLSFQFSYGGTIGIILFQKFISKNFLEKIIKSKKIIEIISVTISAQIIILPISIITNLIIGFIIGPVMACGFIFLITLIINVKTAQIFSIILQIAIKALILTSQIAKLPYSNIYLPTPNFIQIIIYFLSIHIFMFIYYIYNTKNKTQTVKRFRNIISMIKFYLKYRMKPKTKSRTKIISIIIIALIMVMQIIPKDLKVYFVDVNQGDSTFIVTPKGKTILIDGGGSSYTNVGKNTLLPYILDRGYTKIDIAIISHMDLDHCDGIIYLMDKIKIKTIIIGKQYEESDNYKRFVKLAKEKRIEVKIL